MRKPKVHSYEVEALGLEVRVRLQLAQVRYTDLDALCVPDEDGQVSVSGVMRMLRAPPFSVRTETLLLARYLVESNVEDWVVVDEERRNDVAIVRSVLKQLVRPYELFGEEEAARTQAAMGQALARFRPAILDGVKQVLVTAERHLPEDQCLYEDLLAALKFCDITLTPRQQEFLLCAIYRLNGQLNTLDYVQLISSFDTLASEPPSSVQQYLAEEFESPTPATK